MRRRRRRRLPVRLRSFARPTSTPVCGCDGITYSNACVADGAGVTVDHEGECGAPEEPVACDGATGVTCPAGQFCKHADGACGADVEGVCTAPADLRADRQQGVRVRWDRFPQCLLRERCRAQHRQHRSVRAVDRLRRCDRSHLHRWPVLQARRRRVWGRRRGSLHGPPLTCEPIDSPVCACGGIGFPNVCYANAVGLNLENTGTCGAPVACDGATGVTCSETQFCKHPDGACGADVQGVCTDRPLSCEPIDDKVCACGGIGFPNACFANAVGFNIANTGVCTP